MVGQHSVSRTAGPTHTPTREHANGCFANTFGTGSGFLMATHAFMVFQGAMYRHYVRLPATNDIHREPCRRRGHWQRG